MQKSQFNLLWVSFCSIFFVSLSVSLSPCMLCLYSSASDFVRLCHLFKTCKNVRFRRYSTCKALLRLNGGIEPCTQCTNIKTQLNAIFSSFHTIISHIAQHTAQHSAPYTAEHCLTFGVTCPMCMQCFVYFVCVDIYVTNLPSDIA